MAGNRQQFTLQFNADTAQAKKDIQNLLKSLNNVQKINLDSLGITQEIREASQAAQELGIHLKTATNATTGQLNLVEFNNSIKASGQSVAQLMGTLANGGQAGQQAFQQMASAIANTQVPIKQTNALLSNMMTTLKNTVKWELSSSVVHGLESAFSNAVSYVKDLNTSLTNIRIVTGQSAEDMVKFASAANLAAKELSTTTKAYADAALIYYQQGDTQEQVAKKAAITIKAANSSFGTSAAEMSEYLTAVWNSYQVGADELERYVDIMASLGAKTATSLEEIATSMQKVAATANTVGVSMEQVSSIIATVSSVTRESAESIGTSYKTIFARIGDLKLGKTLEDGVGLGQVSSELEKIGVKILDANGEMRAMGDIIMDLGNKWQTMASAEKTAIAQVVAGKRQYTQLMALFENWDAFGENLNFALNSEGALEEMNSIYEEGVHAAQNRAKTAMEGLYSALLNDKALVQFAELTAKIAENITGVAEALGGLGGVATTVGGILLRTFSSKIGASIKSIGQGIASFVTNGNYKDKYLSVLSDTSSELANSRSLNDSATLQQTQKLLDTKQKLLSIEDSLTAKQAEYAQAALSGLAEQIGKLNELEQTYLETERAVSSITDSMQRLASIKMQDGQGKNFEQIFSGYVNGKNGLLQDASSFSGVLGQTKFEKGSMMTAGLNTLSQLTNMSAIGQTTLALDFDVDEGDSRAIGAIAQQLKEIQNITKGTKFEQVFSKFNEGMLTSKTGLQEFRNAVQQMTDTSESEFTVLSQKIADAMNQIKDPAVKQQLMDMFTQFLQESGASADALQRFRLALEQTNASSKKLSTTIEQMNTKFTKIANGVASAMGTMTSLVSGMQMLSSATENIATDSSSWSDNLVPLLSGLSSIVSMIPTAVKALKALFTALGAGAKASKFSWIAGIIAAVVSIGVSIYKGIKDGKEEAKRLKLEEEAKKAQKEASEDSQEISNKQRLISNYNSLYETYLKTGEGQDQLRESAYALAEAYGLVGANVLIAEGNFKSFNQELLKAISFDSQITSHRTNQTKQGDIIANASADPAIDQFEISSIASDSYREAYDNDAMYYQNRASQFYGTDQIQLGINNSAFLGQSFLGATTLNDDGTATFDLGNFVDPGFTQYGWDDDEYYVGYLRELALMWTMTEEEINAYIYDDIIPERLKQTAEDIKTLSLHDFSKYFNEVKPGEGIISQWDALNISYGERIVFKLGEAFNAEVATLPEIAEEFLTAEASAVLGSYNDLDFMQFFDENGRLIWNDLSTSEKITRFNELSTSKEAINGEIDRIKTEMETLDEEDPLYDAYENYLAYLEEVIKAYDKILTNEDVSQAIANWQASGREIDQLVMAEENLQRFFGQTEADVSLKDFNIMMSELSKSMDANWEKYPTLKEIVDANGGADNFETIKNMEEYQQAKSKLMTEFVKDWTAFDEYILIYNDVIARWTNTDDQNAVFDAMEALEINEANEVTSGLLNAFKLALDNMDEAYARYVAAYNARKAQAEADGKQFTEELITRENFKLQDDILVQAAVKANQDAQKAQDSKTKATQFKQLAKQGSENMDAESAAELYKNYWEIYKSEAIEGMLAWEDFVAMDYDQRTAYLDYIAQKYQETAIKDAEIAQQSAAESAAIWKSILSEDRFAGMDETTARGYQSSYDKTMLGYKLVEGTTDTYYRIADGQDKGTYTSADIWKEATGQETGMYSQANVQDYLYVADNYNAAQGTADNLMGVVQANKLLAEGSETVNEKITRTSIALGELAASAHEFVKTGKLSANALLMLQKNGIDPKTIRNANDYLKAMRSIQKEQENAIDAAKTNYATRFGGEQFDPNKVWTEAEMNANGGAQYKAWLEIREMQVAAAETEASIYETALQMGETYIAQIESQAKYLQEQAKKYKDTADILSEGILTGELSFEDMERLAQSGYTVASGWDTATDAIGRASQAAAQYSTYASEILESADATLQFYTDAANKNFYQNSNKTGYLNDYFGGLGEYKDQNSLKAVFDKQLDMGWFDDGEYAAWMAAYESAISKGLLVDVTDYGSAIEIVRGELLTMGEDVYNDAKLKAAAIKDSLISMYGELGAQEAALAESVVATWEAAFNKIADLRKSIIMGEDVGESLTSSLEDYLLYRGAYQGEGTLANAYKTGSLKQTNLSFANYADGSWLEAILDTIGAGRTGTEKQLFNYNAETGKYTMKSESDLAALFGIKQSDFKTADGKDDVKAYRTAIWEAIEPFLTNLLEAQGKNEQEVSAALAGWKSDFLLGAESFAASATKIEESTNTFAEGAAEYQALMQSESELALADAAYQAEVSKQQEVQDKALDYAAVTDSIMALETRNAETIASVLKDAGISPEAYIEAMQANGYDVNSLDDIAAMSQGTLENVEWSFEQDAIAAGNAIIRAGEIFMAIVTGEGLDKYKDDKGNVVLGDYSTSTGLGYSKDSIAGQQAAEYVATSTENQNNMTNSFEADRDEDRTTYYNKKMGEHASNAGFSDVDEFKAYAETLNSLLDEVDRFDTTTEEGKEQLYEYAEAVAQAEDGFKELQSVSKDTWKLLNDSSKKGTKEWVKNMQGMRKTMSKTFNTDMKYITSQFVEDHLDEMEKMANGTEEEAAAAQEVIQDDLVKAVMDADGTSAVILINAETGKAESALTYLQTALDQWDGEEIGFTINADTAGAEANVIASLQSILDAGAMTADQISAALNSIGWEPEITWEEHTGTAKEAQDAHGYVKTLNGYEEISQDIESTQTVTYYIPKIGSMSKISSPRPRIDNGGNGGGGGSKPKKLDKKKPEDHKERYHETNQTLERLADELDKVDKFKSRAYGKGHLDAIKQEISLLKQEIDVQADYLKQAKEYLAMDRNRVASLGATFNADGTISNYDELMDSIIAKYNAFVDKYNSSSAKQQENMEEEKERMDEWFDEAIEWISQYEETLNLTRDKENEILELQNEISAKALEGIQYKIEFEVELNEEETDFLDYLNEKYGEVLEKQDIMVENLVRQQQLAQENLAILNNAKAELDAKYASGELSQADYVSGLKDINDQILENLSTLEDLRKEIQEAYGNALEMATEAINNHTEKMEHASSMMQSYISIMGLIGQGVDYKKLSEFYEKQYEYNLNSLKTQQDYLDVLKEEQAYYLAKMAAGELTETERKQFEALQDTIAEVEEGILSKTEETLTALREAFALTVEGILKGFEESIAGAGNSLEDLAADYEYYLEVQERNVSASKELYEISKLNRQIEQDIADTSSSVYKQRLAALQEEIKAKSADRALTEYDIQMMNLEYELLQRQMALEEAKNAKDTVRLTRDSSGNMVYQYTANQDQIAEAQQGVEDVLQRMAEANAERVTQLEQETIDTYQNMVSQIEEIANSEVLTQEEKNAKIAEIVARTQEKMSWIQDQYIIATENTASTYELIQEQYGANMADAAQMTKDSMNGTIGEIIAKTNEFAANMSQVQIDVANELALLYQNMDTVLTTTKWDQAAESIKNYDLVIEDAEQDAQKMINTLGGEDGLLDKIKDTTAAWDAQSAAIDALIEYYEKLYQSILKIQQTESTKTPPLPSTPSTTPSTETKTEEKTPTTTEPEDEEANANQVQYQGGSWQFYTYDAASGGKRGAVFHGNNKSPVVTKEDESANRIKISGMDGDGHSFSGSWISKVYKNKELWKAYETGGLVDYTGPAWVDGTKNRPELMLNASDTENMLTAVQTVRSLDIATLAMLDDFIKLAASSMLSATNLHASGVANKDNTLQQEVHITAEFPNVQDSNEIQDAFDNLINRATQFVGSIKKY